MNKKRVKLSSSSNNSSDGEENDYSLIEQELHQTRIQSNQLKDQLNSILNHYEQHSLKLIKTDKELKEKELKLNERELIIVEKEETLKEREERIESLEKKLATATTIETQLGKNQVVKLNVGGKIFATNLITLRSVKDTFFTGYFNDHFNPTREEDDNAYFIDRPNEQFHLILNYLRGIDIREKISSLNDHDLNDFIEEVVYYQITPIYELLPSIGKQLLKSKYSIIYEGNIGVEFDPNYCSFNLNIETPTRVRKSGSQGWNSSILGTQCNYFKVKLSANCSSGVMIGFAPRIVNVNDTNYTTCGYYLNSFNGRLYSQRGVTNYAYSTAINNGSIVECELLNGNISYTIDGKQFGIAYLNVENEHDLYPAFEIFKQNCILEFINE